MAKLSRGQRRGAGTMALLVLVLLSLALMLMLALGFVAMPSASHGSSADVVEIKLPSHRWVRTLTPMCEYSKKVS